MTKWLGAVVLTLALTACAGGHSTSSAARRSQVLAGIAPNWRWVDTHGIEVAVPARWRLNRQHCGTPEANTVLWLEDGVLTCLAGRRPRGLSVVEFGGVADWRHGQDGRRGMPVTIDGARAFRRSVGTINGSHEVQLVFPRRGISVSVLSPRRSLLQRILASVRVVRVNETGCPTRPSAVFRSGPRPTGQPFVPRGAVRVIACDYKGLWLDQSNRIGHREASRLARAFEGVPRGFSRAPRNSILASFCGTAWRDSLVVAHFEYANRKPVTVSAHLDGCSRLGASNGRWAVRLRPRWVWPLVRGAHYAGDFRPYAE